MTVETTLSRITYTGAGTTGPFSFPYYFLEEDDLVVLKVLIADGTSETLVLTTDYTITGEGEDAGGEITLVSSLSSSYKLVIYRDPDALQETAYPENNPFPASSHENALDKLTMLVQRLKDLFSRTATLADSDISGASPTLPIPTANSLLAWNSDADGLENIDPDTITTVDTGNVHAATSKATPVDADELALIDSAASFGLKKLTWANLKATLVAYLSALTTTWGISTTGNAATATTATTATTANRVDSGEVTVTAHATTGDIFAAAANSILWDDSGGAITTTIFPNASKAGMARELRCNGASKFTAGANLLIEGIPSGTTITLAAGALVKVRAITTTQFKMTYSLSGTFTATGTGFTAGVTNTAAYKVENGVVTLTMPTISGTSNTTAFTITGLPAIILPLSATNLNLTFAGTGGLDASAACLCYAMIQSTSSGILNIGKNSYAGAWTASGTKTFNTASMSYHLAF